VTAARPATVRRRVALAGLSLLGAGVVAFGVMAPPERCPKVTAGDLRAAATEAADWFARNQEADGTWLYLYDAEADRAADEYNVVRHAGGVMGLYQAAAAGVPGALATADRGLGWAQDHLIERDDWAALSYQGRTATGATALLVAGLVERREATGDDRYDELLAELGRFLAAQTEPSGAVLANYDMGSRAPEPGVYSAYFTGETYWALARLHRLEPVDGWGEVADRIGAYLATRRDDAEDHWPPIPDHWAAYGLAETVAFGERPDGAPLTADEVAYAREQAGYFGSQVRWVSQRHGPWGALSRTPRIPRGGGYGVVGEALTGLWRVALSEPRLAGLRAPLAERATCIAALAARRQVDAGEATGFPNPGRAQGAWFREGETRMDDQQHALSALLRTIAIVDAAGTAPDRSAGPGDPGGVRAADSDGPAPPAPSSWLWAVALVAALNPFRAALGVPRGGDRAGGPSAARIAALGGALGAVVVLAVALAGGWLLDVLDVSDPAARLAVGALALVAGVADLVRRPPSPEPALAGWGAALVPVAVPLVLRPALVLGAVSAGADVGGGLVAAALVVATGALAGLATVPESGAGDRATRWASRLTAAVLVAASVLLVVDGILDV
jgi:small neutral amino acid transporter SnatA (MarC family)